MLWAWLCQALWYDCQYSQRRLSWTRFWETNKALYCSKNPCRFFNRLHLFDLSKTLFVLSKFARNLLTDNRRESFNRERRKHIKIWWGFICWKYPSIIRYRRVQLGLLWLSIAQFFRNSIDFISKILKDYWHCPRGIVYN